MSFCYAADAHSHSPRMSGVQLISAREDLKEAYDLYGSPVACSTATAARDAASSVITYGSLLCNTFSASEVISSLSAVTQKEFA